MAEYEKEEELKATERYYATSLVKTVGLYRRMAYTMAVVLAILLLTTFLPWTQNIRSRGVVTTFSPQDRPQTINATIPGRIEKWHVIEGQKVKKGDTIVSLSEVKDKFFDPQLLLRIQEQINAKKGSLDATNQKAKALQAQINALYDGREFKIRQAKNKVLQAQLKNQSDSIDFVTEQVNYQIAIRQFDAQKRLYDQGLKSLTELEDRKQKLQLSQTKLVSAENKYLTSANELVNARIELNSINAEYLDKISKAESDLNSALGYVFETEGEIAKMINEYANLEIRSSFYQILAPQDGFLVKVLKAGLGETVKEQEAIATIIPLKPELAVELYVKPMDVPLLAKGRKVRLQFDGWPALVFSGWPNVSFGTFGGLVAVIDNIDSQGKYRILVKPDPNDPHPWPDLIRVGSGAFGWALLQDVPIWYELWRQLNGFPADFVNDLPLDHDNPSMKKESKEETAPKEE
jgi:multidrug efflux pump subunit AcrA (membrane-fusion protein)